MSQDEHSKTVALRLALHPKTRLWVALYKSSDPHGVSRQLRSQNDVSSFAIVDARRIVSLDHLAAAANMALLKRKERQTPASAWDIVLSSAGSTHAGHVIRDYAFGEAEEGAINSPEEQDARILALGLDCSKEEFHSTALQLNLKGPQPLTCFPAKRTEEEIASFIKMFKLTQEEIEMSSLEKAVLTKIATKYYV